MYKLASFDIILNFYVKKVLISELIILLQRQIYNFDDF